MSSATSKERAANGSSVRDVHGRPRGVRSSSDDLFDQSDVPATVVCAFCGDAECSGCQSAFNQSGIVAMVPWERNTTGWWTRLWTTVRGTTREAEYFFTVLPDGDVAPAFRFALLSELLAVTSFIALVTPVIIVVAPEWVHHLIEDDRARDIVFRMVALGIPALSFMLIGAHTVHGLALNYGAVREGASADARRSIRFGLYAAGWDVMTSPLGVLVFAYREGPRMGIAGAFQIGSLPSRSARAFLLGAFGIEGSRALRPLRVATRVAVVVTAIGSVSFLAVIAIVLLL